MPPRPIPRGSILVRMTQDEIDELTAIRDRLSPQIDGKRQVSLPALVRRVLRDYLKRVRARDEKARGAGQ